MKFKKGLLLLLLMSTLSLSACDDGGFSLYIDSKYKSSDTPTVIKDDKEDNQDTNSKSGASGSTDDTEVETDQKENDGTLVDNGQQDTPIIEVRDQVVMFESKCLKASKDSYVNVAFEGNPFDAYYDFSYYTVNDKKLGSAEYVEKETISGQETYKLYVGSTMSGLYIIKLFNKENKQYGQSYVEIKFEEKATYKPYVSVAFNLVQVRFVSFVFVIQTNFQKVANFFKDLFNNDRLSY